MRKNKFIQRKQQSMKNIMILLILIIGLGYALLSQNLNINGITSVANATWDIHWENVQVVDESVEANTPVIDTAKTTVTYSVILNTPGDFYEFTVDAVNEGTIDGMIESITSKLNGTTITTLPDYLDYTVTYSDDVPLAVNQLLAAGDTETYKVRIKYKDDIEINQIPATDQNLALQFTVKYKQADENVEDVNHPNLLYNILKDAATEGIYAKEYTGSHQDKMSKVGTKKIYYWYGSNSTNGTAILNKNNVIFAGFCWQMIRTTDTGGVKTVYNGLPNNGECNNSGVNTSIGTSAFNTNHDSPAYAGYKYNPSTLIVYKGNVAARTGSLFGTGISYSGGIYTLTSTSTTYDATHHYTCNNTTGTCSTVRYYFRDNYYIEISDGRTIEQALTDMLSADNVNQTDSVIKTYIDNWYAANMTSYTSKLEDTIFCNDRSIYNLGGWNPNGGNKSTFLQFKHYTLNNDLSCTNTIDKFSMANPKAQLTYPVGLLTSPETCLLNDHNALRTGQDYWIASPYYLDGTYVHVRFITSSGSINASSTVSNNYGVRPVVSLKPGTLYTSGDGSKNNPYIVE